MCCKDRHKYAVLGEGHWCHRWLLPMNWQPAVGSGSPILWELDVHTLFSQTITWWGVWAYGSISDLGRRRSTIYTYHGHDAATCEERSAKICLTALVILICIDLIWIIQQSTNHSLGSGSRPLISSRHADANSLHHHKFVGVKDGCWWTHPSRSKGWRAHYQPPIQ